MALVNAHFSWSNFPSLSLEHISVTNALDLDGPISCGVTSAFPSACSIQFYKSSSSGTEPEESRGFSSLI